MTLDTRTAKDRVSRMLSGPQREFAKGIASGLNQTQAYLAAYPKSSEAAARRSASVHMTNPDILAEIVRLEEKAESRFLMTREQWLQEFKEIGEEARSAGDFSAAKGCLREIGLAMPKWYQPAEVDGRIEVVVVKQ
jgi:phage terminase small subunit